MISGQAQIPISPGAVPGDGVVMDDAEFDRWVRLLEQRTGVVVPHSRRQFLESNLRLRLAELKLASLDRYHDEWLVGRNGAREWAVLVDRLTVHETRFFRHTPSLALLREHVLPAYMARSGGRQEFHAWSVGCATGEEAYSLAMVIEQYARQARPRFRFAVTGSDVSGPALKVAQAGVYAADREREVPEAYRGYCRPHGMEELVVDAALRTRTRFAQLNLLDIDRQPMTGLELIYCQNVLIYFPRARREAFLDQLVKCLRPGGCLIIGPGEVTQWRNPQMARIDNKRTLAFCRLGASSQAAKDSSS